MQSAKVDETITVAHQIEPEDVAAIRAAGFVAIVNNRPVVLTQDKMSLYDRGRGR